MNYHELVNPVCDIAKAAGKILLSYYENIESWNTEIKADHSPVTAADKAANLFIINELKKISSCIILAEESEHIDFSHNKDVKYFWLVDPMDGTKEFLKRNGEFTVNIALIEKNKSVLGVVYIPVTDELFFATYQNGAFQRIENEDVILQASKFSIQDSGLTIVCTRSHLNDLTQQFITQFKCPNVVPVGSSIKYIKLAKGEAHIYPCLYPTMEWDTAAAQIILEEAGGKVIDFSTQMPLTYNKHNLKNHGQIALAKEQ